MVNVRSPKPGSTRATIAALRSCNRPTVVIVKCLSHRLTVRADGTTRTPPNRRNTGIVLHIGQMPQPTATDDQQSQQQAHHRDDAVVARWRCARERLPRDSVARASLSAGVNERIDETYCNQTLALSMDLIPFSSEIAGAWRHSAILSIFAIK